jgi:hypothetical protein
LEALGIPADPDPDRGDDAVAWRNRLAVMGLPAVRRMARDLLAQNLHLPESDVLPRLSDDGVSITETPRIVALFEEVAELFEIQALLANPPHEEPDEAEIWGHRAAQRLAEMTDLLGDSEDEGVGQYRVDARFFAARAVPDAQTHVVLGPTAFQRLPGLAPLVKAFQGEEIFADRLVVLPSEISDAQLINQAAAPLSRSPLRLVVYAETNDSVVQRFIEIGRFRTFTGVVIEERRELQDLLAVVMQLLHHLGVPEALAFDEALVEQLIATVGLEAAA